MMTFGELKELESSDLQAAIDYVRVAPLEFMMAVARDESFTPRLRFEACKAALPSPWTATQVEQRGGGTDRRRDSSWPAYAQLSGRCSPPSWMKAAHEIIRTAVAVRFSRRAVPSAGQALKGAIQDDLGGQRRARPRAGAASGDGSRIRHRRPFPVSLAAVRPRLTSSFPR
jgi:hypothetical protein